MLAVEAHAAGVAVVAAEAWVAVVAAEGAVAKRPAAGEVGLDEGNDEWRNHRRVVSPKAQSGGSADGGGEAHIYWTGSPAHSTGEGRICRTWTLSLSLLDSCCIEWANISERDLIIKALVGKEG